MPNSRTPKETIAILSPGDMGHAVGRLLREHEVRVLTCLDGRSPRTKSLSEQAGITDVPTMNELVEQSDLILSITVSEAVPKLCQQVADAVAATGTSLLFAECNAISPQLSRRMAKQMESIISAAGSRYVDASIIGGPPRGGSSPRFYVSGAHAPEMEGLTEFGLDIRIIGPDIGQASGIKMCYAAMTKGSAALFTELLMAAEMLGLSNDLLAEFQSSQPAVHQRMEGWLPGLPAKSNRWVSEMQEIEATFDGLGLTPLIFQGVADMYRLVGSTSMGEETPETKDESRSLEETIQQLAAHMKKTKQ